MAQWVKDLALSLLGLWLQPWHGFYPWPGNFSQNKQRHFTLKMAKAGVLVFSLWKLFFLHSSSPQYVVPPFTQIDIQDRNPGVGLFSPFPLLAILYLRHTSSVHFSPYPLLSLASKLPLFSVSSYLNYYGNLLTILQLPTSSGCFLAFDIS